jgi:hypothetical protein
LVYCHGLVREQVGRSLPETLDLRIRGFGRGKSEHYRAASPLTAGRLNSDDDKCNRK